jgi:group I intron endonuclease
MYTLYIHICPNKKVYIGITGLNPQKRWGKNGILYKSQLFYEAIEEFGWNNIEHKILLDNLTKSEAEKKEIEFINKYKSNNEMYGYNISEGGIINRHSQKTREKMSKTRKGKPHSEAHNKAVSEGSKGKVFSKSHIENLRKSHIGYKMPLSQKQKISESCKNKGTKAVKKISLDGEVVEIYSSLNDALASVGGKNTGNISMCCKGKRPKAYGYRWEYA